MAAVLVALQTTCMFGQPAAADPPAAKTLWLLGRLPSAVDGALLASCPCDLVGWRKYMMRLQNNNPIWSAPIRGLSPQELAGSV